MFGTNSATTSQVSTGRNATRLTKHQPCSRSYTRVSHSVTFHAGCMTASTRQFSFWTCRWAVLRNSLCGKADRFEVSDLVCDGGFDGQAFH